MQKIAIVGPESSGKSALSEALATRYNSHFVKEYAREYLLNRNNDYEEKDLLEIAKGQLDLEQKQARKANQLLFCDTTILVIIVWALYKYGRVDPKIVDMYRPEDYALHLLLKPDLIYSEDPLRENPSFEEREQLFDIYHQKLRESKANFEIIGGQNEVRLKNAQKALQSHFS